MVLSWDGEGHTAYPKTSCIRTKVDSYLITDRLAGRRQLPAQLAPMGVLFALLAAATYGVSDFVGGLASRRMSGDERAAGQLSGRRRADGPALPVYGGPVSGRTLAWSLAGGVAGLAGVALLYSALAVAPMNIISPVTAVMSAAVPVLGGVLRGRAAGTAGLARHRCSACSRWC